jgi:putative membrane protein
MIDYDANTWATMPLRWHGSVLPRLLPRVVVAALVGTGAEILRARTGYALPPMMHTLLGVALGLLLGFRTNASYDRFWEGRRLLGMYVNRTRDLGRQIVSYVEGPQGVRHRAALFRLINLGYAMLVQSLRAEDDLTGVALEAQERDALASCKSRPTLVHAWLGRAFMAAVHDGALSEMRLVPIETNLTSLADSWGAAERIARTPIPFAYAQHIKTFLIVFTFTAPFALVDSMKWLTPLASALVAFALFGIDEIGVEIEQPFGRDPNDLPLERIGATIARDLEAAASATD